ncbi:hypothetical protein HDV04_004203 [Boothiomyces sp. JEL0838]|nr:hypothetical protein HDV04_004203 [Boothiomyces sp. JEL0838]
MYSLVTVLIALVSSRAICPEVVPSCSNVRCSTGACAIISPLGGCTYAGCVAVDTNGNYVCPPNSSCRPDGALE